MSFLLLNGVSVAIYLSRCGKTCIVDLYFRSTFSFSYTFILCTLLNMIFQALDLYN
jgi:uncharacterized cysteine cluster protein YcgN (CxxCxxCC family)